MSKPKFSRAEILLQREWILNHASTPDGVTPPMIAEMFGMSLELARDRCDYLERSGKVRCLHYSEKPGGRSFSRFFRSAMLMQAWLERTGYQPTERWKKERATAAAMPNVAGERVPIKWVSCLPDKPIAERPGQNDHAQHPSRRGNKLYFPDGRVERIEA